MAHRAPNPKNPEERTRDGDAARGAPTLEEREERGSRDTVHVARVRRGGGAARRSSPRGRPGPGRSSRRSRANGRDEQNPVEVFARRHGIVTARSIAKANRGRHHTHLALLGDVGGGHDAVVARRRTSAVEKGCARRGVQGETALHEPPVHWYRRKLLPAQALAWTKSPTMSTYSRTPTRRRGRDGRVPRGGAPLRVFEGTSATSRRARFARFRIDRPSRLRRSALAFSLVVPPLASLASPHTDVHPHLPPALQRVSSTSRCTFAVARSFS